MRIMVFLLAAAIGLLPLLPGGMTAMAGEGDRVPVLVADNTAFALEMYDKIGGNAGKENVFFSPYSVSTALGMTYAGARGNTEAQMAKALHFSLPQEQLHPAFARLAEQMNSTEGKGYQLQIANALWGQQGYPFAQAFIDIAAAYYQGGFTAVDFAGNTEGSRQLINRWVEQHTADKVKDLLHPGDVDGLTRLVLTNAIYFKGDWAQQFKKTNTRQEPFFTRPESSVMAEMMHQTGRFGYARTENMQLLAMPYVGDELEMVLLLPEQGEAGNVPLCPGELQQLLDSLTEQQVKVAMPKFKFETRYSLPAVLSDLGMTDAFAVPPADFSGMDGSKGLYITNVIHQAVIEVNEEGSEAAAATAVVVGIKSMPSPIAEFRADRPFTFLIRHKATGSILFLGKVANPQ